MDRRTFMAMATLAEQALAAEPRTLLLGDTAPYAYLGADQQPTGAAYEMVQALAQDLPLTLQAAVVPMARAFRELDARAPALIIPPARIPAREQLLRWVAPLIPVRLMLFAQAGSQHDISSFAAARDLEIGILSAPGLEEAYRAAGLQRVKRLASNETAIRMLLKQRLPAVLTADCSVYTALRAAGVARSELREGAVLARVTLWLAASKHYPEAELQLWQQAAQRRRSQLASILASYV